VPGLELALHVTLAYHVEAAEEGGRAMSVDAAVRATPTRPPIHENRRDERANGASQHHTTREGDMVVSEPYERINHWDAPVLTSTDDRTSAGNRTKHPISPSVVWPVLLGGCPAS